ncbi:MAG: tRNA (guanosine(37)-N1)-methyltransferase TrmD [Leptospira sp.]|nr:tRNA (guanosine(37)-N1)-methyltransferase TrmD [Leptospira sp.]
MLINFLTLFPEKIRSYFESGLPRKALDNKIFEIKIINLRDFSEDKFGRVDDTVYGGGPGMLLKVAPIDRALKSIGEEKGMVLLTSPAGEIYTQGLATEFKNSGNNITIISGYYEGVDHRVREYLVDREVSIGNFVLSSGDLPALCIADSVIRLIPGFMGGGSDSLSDESHNVEGVLEYPQYTKPESYNGWIVPEVLRSGNHSEIKKWNEKNRKTQIPE